MSSLDPTLALWPFAVQAYALPGVAAQCLRLQDEHGLDVDVLLAILWQARRGVAVDEATLERMLAAAAPAHARVLELRALRRTLAAEREREPRWQDTYAHVKAAELAAERVELDELEHALADPEATASEPVDPAALAVLGLRRYAARCGASSSEPLLHALALAARPRSTPAGD